MKFDASDYVLNKISEQRQMIERRGSRKMTREVSYLGMLPFLSLSSSLRMGIFTSKW